MFTTIKILFKQANVKTGLLIELTFLMMIVVRLYENSITSSLIVPTEIKPLGNLKQVIEAGYKIGLEKFNEDDNYWTFLDVEFEKYNLTWKNETHFQFFNFTEQLKYLNGEFKSQRQKQTYFDRSPNAARSTYYLQLIQFNNGKLQMFPCE